MPTVSTPSITAARRGCTLAEGGRTCQNSQMPPLAKGQL
jgi:hypothetical protein